MGASEKDILRKRVEAKRKELEAELAKAEADASEKSKEVADKVHGHLRELRDSIGEDWDSLTERAAGKLNEWLKKV